MKESKNSKALTLNKRTIANLNFLQMSQIIGGNEDLPPITLVDETCIECPTMDCPNQTTRDMGITPGPGLG